MIVLNSSLLFLRSKKKKVLFTLYSFHPLTNPHGFEKIDVIQAGWVGQILQWLLHSLFIVI